MPKQYSQYTQTSEGWIDTIPEHWQLLNLKALLCERKEKNSPIKTNFILSLSAKQGVVPYGEKKSGGNKAKEDISLYNIAQPNDLLVNCMNVVSGSSGISKYCGAISPVYYALYMRNEHANISYLEYLFKLHTFYQSLVGLGNGIMMKQSSTGKLNTVRKRIPMNKLNKVMLPIPPRPEQDHIVSYLDWQCAEINRFIKTKRKEIRRLQELKRTTVSNVVTHGLNCNPTLKPSGISWIPDIPSYWDIKRAKYMFNKQNRPVRESDGVVTCFRDGIVTLRANRRTTGFTESIQETGYQGVRKGDLVIHVMDAFAGSIGVSDSDGKSTPVYNVCSPKGDYNNYYYAYLLREMARTSYIQSLYRGIRERSSDFKFDVFAQQYLIIPPRNEQDAIVEYLDAFTAKIDRMVAAINSEISHIIEYRTRLISDVITGKVDVRNIEIPALEVNTSEDAEIDEVSDDEDLDDDSELDDDEETEVNEDDDN